jgi:hypothetical protein
LHCAFAGGVKSHASKFPSVASSIGVPTVSHPPPMPLLFHFDASSGCACKPVFASGEMIRCIIQ